ncbi:MAG: DNA helicase RecQ [Rhodospirillales bacterium]|nr:DNA helicase RecQ [Rhodospirillales bacterium]
MSSIAAPPLPLAGEDGQSLATLRRVFGFPAFRGLQAPAIAHVLAGGDALVLMPTGGGKSLCYQVPALCRAGTAVIVSPLIALMDDQVAALRQLGIAAAALHSELDPAEARDTMRSLVEGGLDLLYVSPERLLANGMQDRLARLRLALIAIDEAHCVSQWGHEFRPEYRALAGLGARFPGVPRIALTATADPRTRADILAALAMDDARVFAASFHRPNLFLAAEPKSGEMAQLGGLLARHAGACGIVYCGTRAKTERVAAALAARGHPAVAFHAGLDPEHKRAAAARFRSGEPLVIVATIAFGMGVDRPDVRFVSHLDMPDSPEAWYQQIGRAGRDGDPAETLLLHGAQDIAQARHWLAQSAAPEAQQRAMRTKLEQMIALTETVGCRTVTLLSCFGEALPAPCGHCDNCREPPRTLDATTEARKLLSAIYRTGQIFGAVHVTAVLRGEATEPVLRHGHDRLPTFGIGADRGANFWRGLARQLIARGVIDVDTAGHGGLFLNEDAARPILRGEVAVAIRDEAPPAALPRAPPAARARARAVASAIAAEAAAAEPEPPPADLFAALRAWRTREAKAQSVPPYVIFHDTVLREIAAVRPADLATLGAVKGVGASKLARYGAALLEMIAAFA